MSSLPATAQSFPTRVVSLIESFWRDTRFTFRSLRNRPGFTFIVVLSLALGIGANTSIFSVVDAVLLRPLPIPNPHDLVVVDVAASRQLPFGGTSYLDYMDFRSRSKSFEKLAIAQIISAGMSTWPRGTAGGLGNAGFRELLVDDAGGARGRARFPSR